MDSLHGKSDVSGTGQFNRIGNDRFRWASALSYSSHGERLDAEASGSLVLRRPASDSEGRALSR